MNESVSPAPIVAGRSLLDAPPAIKTLAETCIERLLSREKPWAMAFVLVGRSPARGERRVARYSATVHTIEAVDEDGAGEAVFAMHEQEAATLLDNAHIVAAVRALAEPDNPRERLLWVRIDRDMDAPFQSENHTQHAPVQVTWADMAFEDLNLGYLRFYDMATFEFISRVDESVWPHYA